MNKKHPFISALSLIRNAGKGECFSVFCTSVGWGAVVSGDEGVVEVILPFGKSSRIALIEEISLRLPFAVESGCLADQAALLLSAYFTGERVSFDLHPDMTRFTIFQQTVYASVINIPYGEVRTYGEVARSIGRPTAARGVGAAMAANPLPVIIPCHRVVAASGALCGYSAAGGVDSKKWLLRMEGALKHDTLSCFASDKPKP